MDQKDYYSEEITAKYSDINRALEDRELQAIEIITGAELAEGASVFDAGCGDGKFIQELSHHLGPNYKYAGGDYSESRCEQAREATQFEITQIDFEKKLDFQSDVFDCVYSGEVIEHLYNPDNMLIELNRILKPGGLLIVTTPNMNSWISRILFLFGMQPLNYECSTISSLYGYGILKKIKKQDWPIGHVRLFNAMSLADMLEANGFVIESMSGAVFEFMPKPLRPIDKLFSYIASLASGLVCVARKSG